MRSNARGEPPPEAQAERSRAEAVGGRLQCEVRLDWPPMSSKRRTTSRSMRLNPQARRPSPDLARPPYESLRHELRHLNRPLCRNALAMQANAFEFMQGVRSKITLSALRTGHERDIFDNEETCAFPYRFYNAAYTRAVCPTHITDHLPFSLVYGL